MISVNTCIILLVLAMLSWFDPAQMGFANGPKKQPSSGVITCAGFLPSLGLGWRHHTFSTQAGEPA
jgi:hypothetical protein